MDNLQHNVKDKDEALKIARGFKPYYKWITFNTLVQGHMGATYTLGFKPYYKWITFNTRICTWIH